MSRVNLAKSRVHGLCMFWQCYETLNEQVVINITKSNEKCSFLRENLLVQD